MRNFKFITLLLLASCMLFSPIIANAAVIAKVVALSQGVVIERNGSQIDVKIEDDVHDKDVIITDGTGKVQLMFKDHTFASLSTNTIFAMSDFNFSQNDSSFTANLTKGFARFVTGKVVEANPDAFKVITPEATVGIRGTTFSVLTTSGFTTVSTENSFNLNSVVVNNTVIPIGSQATFGPNAQIITPPTPMSPQNRQELIDRVTIAFAPAAVSPTSTDPNRMPVYDADAVVSQELPFVLEGQNSIAQSPESSAGRADSSQPGTFNPNLIPGGTTGGGSSSGVTGGTVGTGGFAGYAPGTVLTGSVEMEAKFHYQGANFTSEEGSLGFDVDLSTGAISNAQLQADNVNLGTNATGYNLKGEKGTGMITGSNYQLGGSQYLFKDNDSGTEPTVNANWGSDGTININNPAMSGDVYFEQSQTGAGGDFSAPITSGGIDN